MNALDGEVMKLIGQAASLVAKDHKALVVYNEGSHFSAGANLGLALFAYNIAAYSEIEQLVAGGQMAYKALKYAPFPVVGAPAGMALGGGCEILLHCDAIQAHAELYVGLVECGVGLIPGWGGCGEMLDRWRKMPKMPNGPMPAVAKVFEIVSTATVSKSAANAKELGFLRPADGVTMNRDRLLYEAKQKALALVEGYTAPEPPEFRLPGPSGKAALMLAVTDFHNRGLATDYDVVVSDALATVLTAASDGDPVAAAQRERHARARTRRIHDPAARSAHAGPDRDDARNRQTPEKLSRNQERRDASLRGPPARHALRAPRTVRRRTVRQGRGERGIRPPTCSMRSSRRPASWPAKCCCRSTAAATRKAATSKTASCARPRGSSRPTTPSAKAAGARLPPIPRGAARACPRRSTSWSRK